MSRGTVLFEHPIPIVPYGSMHLELWPGKERFASQDFAVKESRPASAQLDAHMCKRAQFDCCGFPSTHCMQANVLSATWAHLYPETLPLRTDRLVVVWPGRIVLVLQRLRASGGAEQAACRPAGLAGERAAAMAGIR